MPDYDVEVLGLAVPAASCPVAAYRPAVTVRNNGIHSAVITGTMRVYRREPPGDLLATYPITLAALAAGASGIAQAATYWTPTAADVGKEFLFAADVTTDLDQVESNNHLSPVTVLVTAAEPPSPPTVEPHAPQHEHGGSDVVDLSDLPGHLADPQTPETHAYRHEAGGADETSVAGMSGLLADPQTPTNHGNAYHSPAMASSLELENHALSTTAHPDATNLANLDVSGPDLGLVTGSQLASSSEVPNHDRMALLMDRTWGHPRQAALGTNFPKTIITPASGTAPLFQLTAPVIWLDDDMEFSILIDVIIHAVASANATAYVSLYFGLDELTYIDIPLALDSERHGILRGTILGAPGGKVTGSLEWLSAGALPTDLECLITHQGAEYVYVVEEKLLQITVLLNNCDANTTFTARAGYIRALHPIP